MKNNHKDLHKWRKMYQNLFWVKFWATEILFIGVLLLIWNHIYSMIINAVGLPDNKITTIISFLLIASILTTINACITFAVNSRQLDYNPCKLVQIQRKLFPEKSIRYFSEKETSDFIAAANTKFDNGAYRLRTEGSLCWTFIQGFALVSCAR